MNIQSTGEYTQYMYDELWRVEAYDWEHDYDSSEVLDRLNATDFFHSFSERLLLFYNEISCSNCTADEAAKDLLHRAKQAGVPLNRGNVNNWFSGKTVPKYGNNDRKNLFAVAFALELNSKQTERLFNKVFLDRAFNKRNVVEFIYLHSISNGKLYSYASALIDRFEHIDIENASADRTEDTHLLADTAERDLSEDALLQFIAEHPHNFALNNTAANDYKQKLLERLTGSIDSPGLAQREFERRQTEFSDIKDKKSTNTDGRQLNSIDFLLYMILGIDLAKKKNADIISIRDIFKRNEISNQFPDKVALSDKGLSSYVLRKCLILLFFYDYWVSDYLSNQNAGNYDGFLSSMDDILHECGFSPLYVGNPYDWLYLYCSACTADDYTPLDRFRGILSQE